MVSLALSAPRAARPRAPLSRSLRSVLFFTFADIFFFLKDF
jgi:hypothetical protein